MRGVAGSGKTIKLCQKAVVAHKANPEWKIALLFFTQSLYKYVTSVVEDYCIFKGVDWNRDEGNLTVFHFWGSQRKNGFYRELSSSNGCQPLGPNQAPNGSPTDSFAYVCKHLLETKKIEPAYDMILIDESQDLMVDDEELLFQGKQPCFWLAYEALRPISADKPEVRRLVWAFDEYQNMSCKKVPTSEQLFGSDEGFRKLLKGRSEIYDISYRNPLPVLMAAHAIGMGLYYREGILAGPTNIPDWKALGYKVDGQFKKGNIITITRPGSKSPNPISGIWKKPMISLYTDFSTRESELHSISSEIKKLIESENVEPERILVLPMDPMKRGANTLETWRFMSEFGISPYIVSSVNKESTRTGVRPDKFREKSAVTVSDTFRAKGNEADFVYITHVDEIARWEDNLTARNLIFIAMTRTRGWLNISGVRGEMPYLFFKELDEAIEDVNVNNYLRFEFKRLPKLNKDFIEANRRSGFQTKINE